MIEPSGHFPQQTRGLLRRLQTSLERLRRLESVHKRGPGRRRIPLRRQLVQDQVLEILLADPGRTGDPGPVADPSDDGGRGDRVAQRESARRDPVTVNRRSQPPKGEVLGRLDLVPESLHLLAFPLKRVLEVGSFLLEDADLLLEQEDQVQALGPLELEGLEHLHHLGAGLLEHPLDVRFHPGSKLDESDGLGPADRTRTALMLAHLGGTLGAEGVAAVTQEEGGGGRGSARVAVEPEHFGRVDRSSLPGTRYKDRRPPKSRSFLF